MHVGVVVLDGVYGVMCFCLLGYRGVVMTPRSLYYSLLASASTRAMAFKLCLRCTYTLYMLRGC